MLAYDNLYAVCHCRRRLVVESKSLLVTIASYVEQHAAKQEIVPGHGYPDEQLVSGAVAHEKMVPVSRQETSSFLGDCTLHRGAS